MKNKINSTTNSTTNMVDPFYPFPNFNQQDCPHRLPCGICSRTNSMCPLNPGVVKPTWINSPTSGETFTFNAAEGSGTCIKK